MSDFMADNIVGVKTGPKIHEISYVTEVMTSESVLGVLLKIRRMFV